MKTFQDVQIGQSFYTSNGAPAKKISDVKAVHLTPQLIGFNFQEAKENVEFNYPLDKNIYGIGKAKGYSL